VGTDGRRLLARGARDRPEPDFRAKCQPGVDARGLASSPSQNEPSRIELVSCLGNNNSQVGLGMFSASVVWRETGHVGAAENRVVSRLGYLERAVIRAAAGESARVTVRVTYETRL
jgi:hypothetical protein